MRVVRANLSKVDFWRVTRNTHPLPITWNTVSYPKEGSDTWLLGNSTDPMPTEPARGPSQTEVEIRYRKRCTCELITGEWCCCFQ